MVRNDATESSQLGLHEGSNGISFIGGRAWLHTPLRPHPLRAQESESTREGARDRLKSLCRIPQVFAVLGTVTSVKSGEKKTKQKKRRNTKEHNRVPPKLRCLASDCIHRA